PEQRIPVPDPVLEGGVPIEPDVRQPRPGPGGRHVVPEQVLGTARFLRDDGRADVTVAELGADHLVALPLLDFGDRDELVEVAPLAAPFAPAARSVARGADVAVAYLPPFSLIGGEQVRAAPAP